MKKATKVALVRLTFCPMQCIVKGMNSFWGKVSGEMLDSLYTCTVPSPESEGYYKVVTHVVMSRQDSNSQIII